MELVVIMLPFLMHLLVVWGVWLLIRLLVLRHLHQLGQRIDYLFRRRITAFAHKSQRRDKGWGLYRHLDDLLYFARKKYEPGTGVIRFTLGSLLLFAAVFLSAWLTIGELPGHMRFDNPFLAGADLEQGVPLEGAWRFPLFLAAAASTMPYLRLRYASAQRRVKGSYDLLEVVKLSAKYTHLSVDALLAQTADSLAADNVLKSPLKQLGASFAAYGSEKELYEEAQRFAKAIGTTFAVEYVSDLLYAEKEGTLFLKPSLMQLNRSMEQQRETILAVKANSRDAISLGIYGNLVVLFASVGTFMFMLKPDVYFRLQFGTAVGMTFLTVIVGSLFVSFMIGAGLAKPKLDYH